jgi:hypothetical protein
MYFWAPLYTPCTLATVSHEARTRFELRFNKRNTFSTFSLSMGSWITEEHTKVGGRLVQECNDNRCSLRIPSGCKQSVSCFIVQLSRSYLEDGKTLIEISPKKSVTKTSTKEAKMRLPSADSQLMEHIHEKLKVSSVHSSNDAVSGSHFTKGYSVHATLVGRTAGP